jgi:hypothetical protein
VEFAGAAAEGVEVQAFFLEAEFLGEEKAVVVCGENAEEDAAEAQLPER